MPDVPEGCNTRERQAYQVHLVRIRSVGRSVGPLTSPKPMAADRWTGLARDDPRWATTVIDTSGRSREDVADDVAAWVRGAVEGHVPVFRAGWWRPGREVRA